jgi:hypothetical protein
MGLSRLDNFLKSTRGTILYVDPNSFDSTDSLENQGNSLTRPFKTIQRALIEAARFSYQRGKDNDRFGKTTILLYPGDHIVDNRPGWIPTAVTGAYKTRSGETRTDFGEWTLNSIFDLTVERNQLYQLNSVHGGIIIPRGTSIVGMDLRKTRIIPKYVPDPNNDNIEPSCVFRLTGACYIWQLTILDADANSTCFSDYTPNLFVPNFSHHKLRAFEYADGVNNVKINDDFISGAAGEFDSTDLEMYYQKVGIVYGQDTGREVPNDYPSANIVDIEPVVDEYRIVGPKGSEVGISSIRAGDGVTSSTVITVTTPQPLDGVSVNTSIQIEGVSNPGYDGKYIVSNVLSSTEFQYKVSSPPTNPLGNVTSATVSLIVDTVSSASPYIFNCSLRTVYGMCGLLADGHKATGFKSMVVAQFTGVGLQKDESAFVKYDSATGTYKDSTSNLLNLSSNTRSLYKPSYENFHIKATNDGYLQLVSVFAIGFAEQFVAENGGDLSINNSNSNFGNKALSAKGFKSDAYARDDVGYISHIISPKELESQEYSVEFYSIDVNATASVATTSRMYLYNQTNQNIIPDTVFDGFRIGSKIDDRIHLDAFDLNGVKQIYSAKIVMPNIEFTGGIASDRRPDLEFSSYKEFSVRRTNNDSENDISDNVISFTEPHQFLSGESVRIVSDDGSLPDGLEEDRVYFAITDSLDPVGLGTTQIKLAASLSDAFQENVVTINEKGGNLKVISKVSDKIAGDYGHPIQWDSTNNQWYLNVTKTSVENLGDNSLYGAIVGLGTTSLGEATSRTYLKRIVDDRPYTDTIYKFRYVIPKDSTVTSRDPLDSFIIQESSAGITTNSEIQKYFDPSNILTLSNPTELRNPRFISTCTWSSGTATVGTELPHNLVVGSEVTIKNVVSTSNTEAVFNDGFNGSFPVVSVNNSRQFTFALDEDPGTFISNINIRNIDLPRFYKSKFNTTYQTYRVQRIKEYIPNYQDGIYHLIPITVSNTPSVVPFLDKKFSQPLRNLYPRIDRDNPTSDPHEAKVFATSNKIGIVVVDDPKNSLTKSSIRDFIVDSGVGIGVTNIVSNSVGTSHTIYSNIDHNLFGASKISLQNIGSNYIQGTYYNVPLVSGISSTTGKHATARVTVGASGTITDVAIMHPGSSYGIGNTLAIKTNISRAIGSLDAVVRVDSIIDNMNQTIEVSGISSSNYSNLYRITGYSVGDDKKFYAASSKQITLPNLDINTSIIGENDNPIILKSEKSSGITTIVYDSSVGVATFTFPRAHGYRVDDKIRVSGASTTSFNGDFIVKKIESTGLGLAPTKLSVNIKNYTGVAPGGNIKVFSHGVTSRGGGFSNETESGSSRLFTTHAGVSTHIGSTINLSDSNDVAININNAVNLGLKLGDYIQIGDEILRIRSGVTSDTVYVFRSLLGTAKETHYQNSLVKKIHVHPTEFRRNSSIRASAHTFEYVGFGPGNYSTSLPEKQDRVLSDQEEVRSISSKQDGGVVFFSGMNSDGDFYTGNKKINSSTGEEQLFDLPVPSVTGEEPDKTRSTFGFDVLSPLEMNINRSIRVEGGQDGNVLSRFDGPVVFNNKITSYSDKGIEASSLYLQGSENVSRKLSISKTKPTYTGNYGDIVFNAEPRERGFAGWMYVRENRWEDWGFVGGYGVGVSSDKTFVGLSSQLDFVGVGVSISVETSSFLNGITTITIDDNPLIAISTGPFNQSLGSANQINFVGGGITLSSIGPAGIVTVYMEKINIEALAPSGPYQSIQFHESDDTFGGVPYFLYNSVTGTIDIGDISFTSNGYVSFGTTNPSSKVEIYSDSERSLYINSTQGSGEIVRIENVAGDTKPFIIDVNGHVGINTDNVAPGISLHVEDNLGIVGEIRFYNPTRTNYTGFKSQNDLSANLVWNLPKIVGSAKSIMISETSGTIGWSTITDLLSLADTDDLKEGSTNLYHTRQRVVNALIDSIGKQIGIAVTYNPSTEKIDYEVSFESGLYPYTTMGFGLMI